MQPRKLGGEMVLYPTIRLYNAATLGLNNRKVGAETNVGNQGGCYAVSPGWAALDRHRSVLIARSCRRIRAGQDLRAQALALGSTSASAAEGAGGLGRVGRESL